MLNPQVIAQMMKLNPQQASKLQQAWGPASNMAKNVNTQQDAINLLQQAGINSTTLAKVKGALNNPMATVLANMAGINLNDIRMKIDALAGGNTGGNTIQVNRQAGNNNPVTTNGLDKFRRGLSQLK